MDSSVQRNLALGGSLIAALAASACCFGPLVLVLLGLGGVGAALALEPYRPYILGVTVLLLGAAFYLTYRRAPSNCGPGEVCTVTRTGRTVRILLWVITFLVLLIATFPYYSVYLF